MPRAQCDRQGIRRPYVPDCRALYKTKAKNAQEAHEAIRPTDFSRRPDQVEEVARCRPA
jgi:DNA topoisomerase IA